MTSVREVTAMLIDDGLELLDEAECTALLSSCHVGRVGITVAGLPVILPVNFTWIDGSIVFRTGAGTKLHAASNGAVIAFELDDYDAGTASGWSVLAIGRATHITDADQSADLEARVERPWAEGPRDHFVRLTPELLTGRRLAH